MASPSRTKTISTIGASAGCNKTSSAACTSVPTSDRAVHLEGREGANGLDAAPLEPGRRARRLPGQRPTTVVLLLVGQVVDVRAEQLGGEQSRGHRVRFGREI